jgi:hypothetical protein
MKKLFIMVILAINSVVIFHGPSNATQHSLIPIAPIPIAFDMQLKYGDPCRFYDFRQRHPDECGLVFDENIVLFPFIGKHHWERSHRFDQEKGNNHSGKHIHGSNIGKTENNKGAKGNHHKH